MERPPGGDELRRWRLHEGETSLLFRVMNRNKRSLTLNLKHSKGRAVALDLIRRSDVVLENFRPGTLERWGLGIERMREVNPGVILVRSSGYGHRPIPRPPGFGGVAEAVGGLRNLTGYPDRPPTRVGISLADSVSGLYAVIGALAALHRRNVTGQGEMVDVALVRDDYSLMESLTPDYSAFQVEPERTGSSLRDGAVQEHVCGDGRYVVISGNGDSIFKRLMRASADPNWPRTYGSPITPAECGTPVTGRRHFGLDPGTAARGGAAAVGQGQIPSAPTSPRPTSPRIRTTRPAACWSGMG